MGMRIENGKAYFVRKFEYQERYKPTPRSRKYLYRRAESETEIGVPCFDEADAPIAFKHISGEHTSEYRLYGEKLYVRSFNSDFYCLNGTEKRWASVDELEHHLNYDRLVRDENYHHVDDLETCLAILRQLRSDYAVMRSGEALCVMQEVGEPMYCIYTFGLGHNHGGTALSIDNHYNSNIGQSRYFNALHYEEAVREAIRIAEARGDTESLDMIQSLRYKIEVLIPEAVKRNPAADHGDGDPFLNKLYAVTEMANDSTEAALLALCVTGSDISKGVRK